MTNPLKTAYKEVKSDIKSIPFIDNAQRTALIDEEKKLYQDIKNICGITTADKVALFNTPAMTGSK